MDTYFLLILGVLFLFAFVSVVIARKSVSEKKA